jgi:hypothetical protein
MAGLSGKAKAAGNTQECAEPNPYWQKRDDMAAGAEQVWQYMESFMYETAPSP